MSQHIQDIYDYAIGVVDGTISVCELVRLAGQRFLNDIAEAEAGTSPWEFRADLAERPIRFCELLPHVKGKATGQKMRLEPWQKFAIGNLWGFVERGTTTRRYRQGTIFVGRGNSKTTMCAPLAIYMAFFEGEGGAEAYSSAVTRDQARILFDSAATMLRNSPDICSRAGITVGAHSIHQLKTASKFVPLSSDGSSLEGLSVAFSVLDEIASHKSDVCYIAILTAMGKRKHPMMISISTPTGNNTGIGKQLYDYGVKILRGEQTDERVFALLYGIDDDDDIWDEATWRKANPNYGVSVMPDAIKAIANQARNNASREAAFVTRHLGRWVNADEALISSRAWRECTDESLTLDDFRGREVFLGVDLASRTDLAGISLVFPAKRDGKTHYSIFGTAFLNEQAVLESRNASYPGWAAAGHILVTPGNETDFAEIEALILDYATQFKIIDCAFDPYAGVQMMQRLGAEGIPVCEFRMNVANLSEPTKELGAAVAAGRVSHPGNPVLSWCIGNVVGREDRNGNIFPTKEKAEAKIDLAIGAIVAIGRAMVHQDTTTSRYEHRPLLVLC